MHAEVKGVAEVWETITRADLERAKTKLAHSRAEMLRRHAEELKALDAEQVEIESLEQLISIFARTYLSSEVSPAAGPTVLSGEQSTSSAAPDGSLEQREQPKAISVDLRVEQQISPSFGAPPRLRRLIGG